MQDLDSFSALSDFPFDICPRKYICLQFDAKPGQR